MQKKTTVDEYFAFPESNRPMELVYGYVHESAMPTFGHEAILLRLAELLRGHVREHNLGEVCRADVVLDRDLALVVQPDLFFISTERLGIVSDRVWDAPDLVIEILSPGTEHRDRTLKLAWYRRYGVKERRHVLSSALYFHLPSALCPLLSALCPYFVQPRWVEKKGRHLKFRQPAFSFLPTAD